MLYPTTNRRSLWIMALICLLGLSTTASATVGTGGQNSPAKRQTRTLVMQVTAYCPCSKCCGPVAQGLTASGRSVRANGGAFVAADTRLLPMFTKVRIPGYKAGQAVPVLDRGGAIKGNRLDVYFPTHEQALKWGRQTLVVTVQR